MSKDLYVVGIRPPDERWKEMKAVWDACEKAEVDVPQDVEDFFDGEPPDERGVLVEIPCSDYSGEDEWGYEINIEDLPPEIKSIRVSIG